MFIFCLYLALSLCVCFFHQMKAATVHTSDNPTSSFAEPRHLYFRLFDWFFGTLCFSCRPPGRGYARIFHLQVHGRDVPVPFFRSFSSGTSKVADKCRVIKPANNSLLTNPCLEQKGQADNAHFWPSCFVHDSSMECELPDFRITDVVSLRMR